MIFPRPRFTAPSSGPTGGLISSWFIKAIEPWLLQQLESVQRGIPYDQLIDLRDTVDGLGSGGDDAARWMQGIAKVPDNAGVYIPPLDYQFKSPFMLSKRKGVRLVSHCIPQPDGSIGCPRILWAGSTGERVIFLDRCDHCELNGVSIEIDASGTAYVAIDADGYGDGMGSQCQLRNIRVHAAQDNDHYEMIRISETVDANHEYYLLDNIQLSGGAGAAGPGNGVSRGVGIKIGASQSKRHTLNRVALVNLGTGIWQRNGSFGGTDITCTNNEIDVRRDNGTEPLRLHINSEHSRQALVDASGMPCEILAASRFGPQWTAPGKGYFEVGELFHMQNASIDDHVPAGSTLFDFGKRARRATLISNRFAPNSTIAELGLETLPLDRCLVLINNDNIKDQPAEVWVRGGRVRAELGWYGDGTYRIVQAVGHALEGNPTFVGVSTEFDKGGAGVGGTFVPAENK